MSRYVKDLPTTLSPEQVARVVEEYLGGEGFKYKNWRGEMAWQKGEGIMLSPQFVSVTPGNGTVHLQAWVAGFAILPGVYVGEMDLSGGFGWAVKAALKPRVAELERRLSGSAAPATG